MKIKVRVYQLKDVKINFSLQQSLELYYSDNLNRISEEAIVCCYNSEIWDIISKSLSIKLVIIDGVSPQHLPKINKTVVKINHFFEDIKSIGNKSVLRNLIISYYLKKYLYKKNNKPFRAYLLRHGETIWNKKKIYQGKLDSQLTEKGFATAQKIAKSLKSANMQILFSSPQKRSVTTSELIAKRTRLKIKIVDQFKEMDLGIFEGKKIGQVKKMFAEYFGMRELSKKMKIELPYPLGESYGDVYRRILMVVLEIACEYDNFAIIGHEGVNRLIRGILQCRSLQESVYLRQGNEEMLVINVGLNNEQVLRFGKY